MRLRELFATAICLALPAMAKLPKSAPIDSPPQGLTVVDWTQIRAEYERHRHGMFAGGGGFTARSFEQQWLTRFDGRGFTVKPDEGAWSWGLELVGVTGKARVSTNVNRITYRWSPDVDEWFLNDTRGLEHGFTLRAPHEIRLAVRGGLRAQAAGTGVEFVDLSGTARIRYAGLTAMDADGRALPARMKVEGGGVTLAVDDRGARYPITIDPIAQQAYLKASNTGQDDFFGLSVAISGDTVVVGAFTEDSGATGVNGNQSDNSATESGAAYVFVRSGATWTQQAYLKASNTAQDDYFGISVAISGDTVVVGASSEDSGATGVNGSQGDNGAAQSGAAYVFARSGAAWSQQAYLKASNTGAGDSFGYFVAVSGETAVVQAYGEDSSATGVNGNQGDNGALDSGAAYVFVRSGATWAQQAYLKASNTGAGDLFGYSVAISGDTVVVGANAEGSGATGVDGNQGDNSAMVSGAAYVFSRSGATWAQQAYLKASNTGAGDKFGGSVSVSGDTLVVGAREEDSSATGVNGNQADNGGQDSGAAYVFVRSGVTWTQQAYLKASNTGVGDYFGQYVAISGGTVAVGAFQEASNATGVDGNQSDNSAASSGAAFVFVRDGATWTQQAYLKASNTGAGDQFGVSVASSGDTVVVGAYQEDSAATGVNGNGADNSASNSSAAYAFIGAAGAANVTITSSPAGLIFNSSGAGCAPGTGYTTPTTLSWTPGSSCSVSFGTPQTGPGGVPYNFASWEDASTSATRAIVAPAVSTTYTATFLTQFSLTTTASPAAGGTISAGGLFNPGAVVNVTAAANPGYFFSSWSGACTGSGACTVTMDAAKTVTANFTSVSGFMNVNLTGPLAVPGAAQTLVFRFTHTAGIANLGVVNVLINNFLNGDAACYIAYSQPLGVLYLVNDLGPGSGISAGLTLGGSGSVTNSQCTINSAGSSAAGSGTTLTLTLNVSYKTAFLGNKVIYAAAQNQIGNSTGWNTMGATIVAESAPTFPRSGTMTPSTGTTSTGTVSFTYSDASAAANLQTAWALINSAIDGRQACYMAYYAPGNTLYLFPDNGDGTQATSIVLTGSNTIENSQCRISAQGSSVSTSGGQLTVQLNYTFKAPFAGFKAIWTATQTVGGGQTSAWKPVGGWQAP